MTTEPRTATPRRPKPLVALPESSLRLYAIAILATMYVVAFLALETPAEEPVAEAELAPAEVVVPLESPAERRTVWWSELPVERRPALALPPGLRVVEPGTEPPVVASAAPVRVSRARPRRLRTRSS